MGTDGLELLTARLLENAQILEWIFTDFPGTIPNMADVVCPLMQIQSAIFWKQVDHSFWRVNVICLGQISVPESRLTV